MEANIQKVKALKQKVWYQTYFQPPTNKHASKIQTVMSSLRNKQTCICTIHRSKISDMDFLYKMFLKKKKKTNSCVKPQELPLNPLLSDDFCFRCLSQTGLNRIHLQLMSPLSDDFCFLLETHLLLEHAQPIICMTIRLKRCSNIEGYIARTQN